MKKILDYDEHTGLTTIYHGNHDGTFSLQTCQDVSGFLKQNKEASNNNSSGWKGEMHEVASIPPIVWNQWWKEFGGNPMAKENRKRLIAKLNNTDFSKLRTKEGRL